MPDKYIDMLINNPIEYIGLITGKFLKRPIIKGFINKKIDKYNIKINGLENIKDRKNAYIIACNHVSPKDGGLFKSGISPDSFVINKIVFEHTGRDVALAINYILGLPFFLKFPLEMYIRGFIKGFGFIPVGAGKWSFHNIFLKSVEKAVLKWHPILIYPSGTRSDDFFGTEEIKAGTAYIALKYNLVIVPTYIKGSTHWEKASQEVTLAFGKPFSTQSLTIDRINEKIKEGILNLKDMVNKPSL